MTNNHDTTGLSLWIHWLTSVAMAATLTLVNCEKMKEDKTPLFAAAALASRGSGGAVATTTGTTTGTGTGAGTGTGTAVIAAPTSLTYTGSPFSYTKGTAITTLTPTLAPTGVVLTGCTASPTLPAGLTVNATTCVISGTPTVAAVATDYIITASNTSGSTTATINIFVEGTTWIQEAYLKAPNAEASDAFGISVSISSDTIAVGANFEDSNQITITNGTTASANNSASMAGAVYVFKRTGTAWAQEAYLKAPNAQATDAFGYSVSISSDTIVVGAVNESSNQTTITNGTTASANNSAASSGAAYVFRRTGTAWAQEAFLKAPNTEASDVFGTSVSISSDTIAVAATSESSNQTTITNGTTASADNSAVNSGAVYVFQRTGTTWAQEAYLKAPNAEATDQLGKSISVSLDTIAVGTIAEDSNQTTITNGATASADNSAGNAGAVYVFRKQ